MGKYKKCENSIGTEKSKKLMLRKFGRQCFPNVIGKNRVVIGIMLKKAKKDAIITWIKQAN